LARDAIGSIFHSQDLVLKFLEDGYIIIPIVGIEPIRNILLEAYECLIQEAEKLGLQGLVKVRKSDNVSAVGQGWSWGCDHIHSPSLHQQCLLDIVNFYPIPDLVKDILGPRVRFCGSHGHWSPTTYDYYLHWHRDTRPEQWKFANPDPRAHVQVIIALMDEWFGWFREVTSAISNHLS